MFPYNLYHRREGPMDVHKPRNTATAYRRQRQIEDCLYDNLLRAPYTSISVADLCRQVGISRKAFYNYYHDKDACLRAIIDRFSREAMMCTNTEVPDNAGPLESTIALLEFWKEHKTYLDIIVRNELLYTVLQQNIEYLLKEEHTFLDLLSTPDVKSDKDILACYMSIQLTLILQWYQRNFDTPTEEMAKKFLRLMHAPMLPPVEEG